MTNSVKSVLEADHESLDHVLAELDAEFATQHVAHALELLDLFWALLAVHIRAENLHLFPALTNASPSLFTGKNGLPTAEEAQHLLLHLRTDHEFFMKDLATRVKTMREIVGSQAVHLEEIKEVRRGLDTVRKRLLMHNRMEEKQVYTWPVLLFDELTVARLCEGLQNELNNLPGRFAKEATGNPRDV